jgi:hypothetical protein
VGLAALLVTPAAWSLSSVLVKGVAVMPSADLSRLGARDDPGEATSWFGPTSVRRLIDFLSANRHGERFLLATSSTRLASPTIIQ